MDAINEGAGEERIAYGRKPHGPTLVWRRLLRGAADVRHWGKYAAITSNRYGAGVATYIGCMTSAVVVARVLEHAVKGAGLWGVDQELAFPLITRSGINAQGRAIHYYFNYSDHPDSFIYPHQDAHELLTDMAVHRGQMLQIDRWGVLIIEEG
jgi:beta-galactosidase